MPSGKMAVGTDLCGLSEGRVCKSTSDGAIAVDVLKKVLKLLAEEKTSRRQNRETMRRKELLLGIACYQLNITHTLLPNQTMRLENKHVSSPLFFDNRCIWRTSRMTR